ncbi:nuclear transport factor 2 family protein [Microbacterium sp. RD1]|uniref:nuclear transport factor 2 family protein n=1 Tax=Microbacterium sp. RD1 TaxID=3457313 RepID=UPI003FA5F719
MELLQAWLDRYLVAWRTNDAEDIRALFTDDATYAGSPLDPEPWSGIDAIVEGWVAHRDEPGEWRFEGAPLAATGDVGIIEGRTDYADGRTYANIWVVRFADDGRARSFVEWFVEPGTPWA